ncbi:hypothetical protein CONCODRAFT_67220 [Conidiobolus coronatus NRRL 28638]|uniref:Uncharacterized protein n=1 Tax=Conidiobolus coronatus (strain ATCC 28846 / CBS 209.66 / NRRL 28638) TaxID=796925 RepID=A0A137PIE6_CONC2|nr:hypothetical protein CONCODRAFT_67220 [Conidiobolus coronatus NRRL 28638]|eukprot:KXN74767.1 hypothetical protein CONCODRAFT_67220 [Conidiobolus coronatus NRRL 28638]
MSASSISFDQFVQGLEAINDFECIEKQAFVSQLRRRGSSVSRCSVRSTTSSIYSTSSTKSAVPSATNLDSALYQKGFEQRQYDSDEEFDLIIEQGFHGNVGEGMPTLKLTLTPDLLRR